MVLINYTKSMSAIAIFVILMCVILLTHSRQIQLSYVIMCIDCTDVLFINKMEEWMAKRGSRRLRIVRDN